MVCGCVFQHDDDPKRTTKATTEKLKKKRSNISWNSLSFDFSLTENVWWELNLRVTKQQQGNLKQLESFCKEGCEKIPLEMCANLVTTTTNVLPLC